MVPAKYPGCWSASGLSTHTGVRRARRLRACGCVSDRARSTPPDGASSRSTCPRRDWVHLGLRIECEDLVADRFDDRREARERASRRAGPPWKSVSPLNRMPASGAYTTHEPGECPGVLITVSSVPATEIRCPSSRSTCATSGWVWFQSMSSPGAAGSARRWPATAPGHSHVVVVPVRQHDRLHGAITDRLQNRRRVVCGIDDDDLVLVADHPDVVVDVPRAAVE